MSLVEARLRAVGGGFCPSVILTCTTVPVPVVSLRIAPRAPVTLAVATVASMEWPFVGSGVMVA